MQLCERLELLRDDLEETRKLRLGALEVLVGEGPDGHLVDAELGAPVEELVELVRAGAMARSRLLPPGARGPAAIPVEDDGDVAREGRALDLAAQPIGVEPVERR
jgi:hypothetical protein